MPYAVPGGASPKMPRDDCHQAQVEDGGVTSNYSSETFESFSEKEGEEELVVVEDEECHLTEVKPSGSLVSSDEYHTESSASGSHSVSKRLIPSSKDEDAPLDPLDSAALQEKLSQRWIQHLKAKESPKGQPLAGPTSHADVVEASKSEQDAMQAFCATKINLIRHQLNSQVANGSGHQRQQRGLVAEKPVTDEMNNCVVPRQLINRISQQNLRAAPSQVSAVKKHNYSRCPECTKKRGELSQLTFVRQKKTFLESALLKEKMDEYRHTKDFLSFVGEIHKSLPRLSDDPETIWKRLNARGQVE